MQLTAVRIAVPRRMTTRIAVMTTPTAIIMAMSIITITQPTARMRARGPEP